MARRACRQTEGLLFLEVGVRSGGGSLNLFRVLHEEAARAILLSVDPYGDKEFRTYDFVVWMDYGEVHYKRALQNVARYSNHRVLWSLYRMTVEDFMAHPPSVYFRSTRFDTSGPYALVVLDGEHETSVVRQQLQWFKPRMLPRGLILVDNANQVADLGLERWRHKGWWEAPCG